MISAPYYSAAASGEKERRRGQNKRKDGEYSNVVWYSREEMRALQHAHDAFVA